MLYCIFQQEDFFEEVPSEKQDDVRVKAPYFEYLR
jgi:hypothetical protein